MWVQRATVVGLRIYRQGRVRRKVKMNGRCGVDGENEKTEMIKTEHCVWLESTHWHRTIDRHLTHVTFLRTVQKLAFPSPGV